MHAQPRTFIVHRAGAAFAEVAAFFVPVSRSRSRNRSSSVTRASTATSWATPLTRNATVEWS
jgi:hypothetical protein